MKLYRKLFESLMVQPTEGSLHNGSIVIFNKSLWNNFVKSKYNANWLGPNGTMDYPDGLSVDEAREIFNIHKNAFLKELPMKVVNIDHNLKFKLEIPTSDGKKYVGPISYDGKYLLMDKNSDWEFKTGDNVVITNHEAWVDNELKNTRNPKMIRSLKYILTKDKFFGKILKRELGYDNYKAGKPETQHYVVDVDGKKLYITGDVMRPA